VDGRVVSERSREVWRLLRRDGARGLAQRAARVAYRRVGAADLEDPLDLDHITDSHGLRLVVPDHRPARGTPLTVGWLCTPPAPGSGGHTTLFRMVEGTEAAGHTCVLYLYDRFAGEISRHERVVRQHWPSLRAEVRSVADGLGPLDAYVASGWETAHVLASSRVPTRRLYFIQDFEPYFYPVGSHYVLAEDTYRFGFRCITVGPMLADLLCDRYGVRARVAEFGCDTSVYRLTNRDRRTGVVFYTRRKTARRGYELGVLALREFHRRHPDQEIHLFGDAAARVPFPAVNHGVLSPRRLAELYNRCAAGLALSFTNLSLVPDEMLACGLTPVVGESSHSRASITNPYVTWAFPTPNGLASALGEAVAPHAPAPEAIAASVRPTPWDAAQRATVETIEDEVYGPA
jgi:glycosyltransferase involved in cell wall biosynthesis